MARSKIMEHFGSLRTPLFFVAILAPLAVSCGPKAQEDSVTTAWGSSGDGFHSAVIGHLKDRTTQKLKQLAMDPATQQKVAEITCKQLPPDARARCMTGLVAVGKVSQGVGTALGAEVHEAHESIKGVLEDPSAVAEGAITLATNPSLVKEQAAALRDDALGCAKVAREAYAKGDIKKLSELVTHAGLLLVPVGKGLKAAKAAEEVSIAARAAEFGARVKVTTDTARGTGCTSNVTMDASGKPELHTTLTVETPLLNAQDPTIETY